MKRILLIIAGCAVFLTGCAKPSEEDYVALLGAIFPGSTIVKMEGDSKQDFYVKFNDEWRQVKMNSIIIAEEPLKKYNVVKEVFTIRECKQATFVEDTINLPLTDRRLSCGS